MAFRTDAEKPHAKIVVQADSHEQLNHILLALNRAVNSYQNSSQRTYSSANTESAASSR